MKSLVTFIFIFNSLFSLAQTIEFNIQGTVKNTGHAKFAYLSTAPQEIINSSKVYMVAPIINGKFEFKGTVDLGGDFYQYACVFVDDRDNISREELESKFKQLIWVVGRENNLRSIILEDINLDIEGRDEMKVSKIVNGGMLTKQSDEENIAVRARNRKLVEFVKKYPDSPISLHVVQSVTNMIVLSNKDRLESDWGSPTELYELLSERLKNSKKGVLLKKRIDEGYKP